MSSESETPTPPAPATPPTPPEGFKPAFKIAPSAPAPSSAAAPRPATATRPPITPRAAAAAGTSVPFKVNVPVEEKKGESPLFVILDLLAAAAAITFAVILYQIHAGPTAL